MAVILAKTASTTTSITLRIEGLSGTSYSTLRITLNGVARTVTLSGTNTTATTFTGLTAGTTYYATGNVVSSGGSTANPTGYFNTKYNAVSSISVSSITSTSATASWSHPTGGRSYRMAVRLGTTSSGSLVAEYYPTGTSQSISGLSAGTTYYVGIVNGYGVELSAAVNTTFTTPVSRPNAPSSVSATSITSDSVYLTWTSATGASWYGVDIYSGTGSYLRSVNNIYSTGQTITGLGASTSYNFRVYGYNSAGYSANYASASATTNPTVPDLYISSVTNNYAYAYWTKGSDVTSFDWELRTVSSAGTYINGGTTSSTAVSLSSLSPNTTYYMKVRSYSSSTGRSTGWVVRNFTTTPNAPTMTLTTNATTAGVVYVYFNTVSGATGYTANIYDGKTNTYVATRSGTTSPLTFTGLKEYYPYGVYLKATSASGDSPQTYGSITTSDVTPPTTTITYTNTEGVMQINWSSSDSGSGLRSTSTYLLSITANGGTTYYTKTYTTNNYYSFTSDGNGNEFVDGGKYYMRVTAYDAVGNNASAMTSQLTFKRARPSDWSWHTSKVSGGTLSLTATEWNSLCTRINQFRQYKGLDNYAFTTVTSGTVISAWIINQALTAIRAMSPPTSTPSNVTAGSTITASLFNNMLSSLLSIK